MIPKQPETRNADAVALERLLSPRFAFIESSDIWINPRGSLDIFVPAASCFQVELTIYEALRTKQIELRHPVEITEYVG